VKSSPRPELETDSETQPESPKEVPTNELQPPSKAQSESGFKCFGCGVLMTLDNATKTQLKKQQGKCKNCVNGPERKKIN